MNDFEWIDEIKAKWDNLNLDDMTDDEKEKMLVDVTHEKFDAVSKQKYAYAAKLRDIERELQGDPPNCERTEWKITHDTDETVDETWTIHGNFSFKSFTIDLGEDYETMGFIKNNETR